MLADSVSLRAHLKHIRRPTRKAPPLPPRTLPSPNDPSDRPRYRLRLGTFAKGSH